MNVIVKLLPIGQAGKYDTTPFNIFSPRPKHAGKSRRKRKKMKQSKRRKGTRR
jgi:hypothetical protein